MSYLQNIPILSVQWKKPQINVTEYQKDNRIRIQKTTTNKTTTQNQNNTKCAGRHFAQRNTNNVSKTCAFLQRTGGKDAPNRVFFPEIVANMTTWKSESKENGDRPSKTWGLISVIWLLLNDLGKYKAIQFIISMIKQIILNNIYIGWFCLKIMLQEDKCIYI